MMELIADSFDIRCCECGEQITIFKDDLDTDVSFYDHGENGMGVETIYEIRHELSCPKCGNNIEITITGNEYPEVHMIMIAQKYPAQSSSKHLRWEWFITKMNLMLTRKLLKLRVSVV